jgi:hypothetical protein
MIEGDIARALKPLVDGRAYDDVAPEGTKFPCFTVQLVGGDPINFYSGTPDVRNGRFQVTAHAASRAIASKLIRDAEDTLREDPAITADSLGGAVGDYNSDAKIYTAMVDFDIWFKD